MLEDTYEENEDHNCFSKNVFAQIVVNHEKMEEMQYEKALRANYNQLATSSHPCSILIHPLADK